MYSQKVMDHFMNPRNVGEIPDADGVGMEGNPTCGDSMQIFIKVENDRIVDAKFRTFGCGSAIAVSSMITELVKGKTLDEALSISKETVAEELGGLPKQKMHCSNLGADALRKAIEDYRIKNAGLVPPTEAKKCYCPVCDLENPMEAGYCTGCGRELSEEEEAHGH